MANFKLLQAIFLVLLFIDVYYIIRVRFTEVGYFDDLANDNDLPIEQTMTTNHIVSYHSLTSEEKLLRLLHKVKKNKDNEYWLANSTMEFPAVNLDPKAFLEPKQIVQISWKNNPLLYYEPRFTLAVYLDELRYQLETRNPKNEKNKDDLIKLPFAWSDWVDLTVLNNEIIKPVKNRLDCNWLQRFAKTKTRFPDFCTNLVDITDDELKNMGFTRDQLPGFVVNKSPMNKATHKPVLMQGKSYLLTHQENPLSIIFLTANGTYEAQILDKREKIVDGKLFERYLSRREIDARSLSSGTTISFNPQEEFQKLISSIQPRVLDPLDDIHNMARITRNKSDKPISRLLDLKPSSFHYSQVDIDRQIQVYENKLGISDKNEGSSSIETTVSDVLTPREIKYYQSLKYCNTFTDSNELTYYKLAIMRSTKVNWDSGWHYEWRFFNGAMKFFKDDSWTYKQLEARQQIILERLLRNWFKFAEAKGIVSWISHGPLLGWYWNGLMFPYDIDIDIQMPSSELSRLALNYNMTLVIEDLNEGYGKYLIDCSTFLHHRNVPHVDNYIDARFIDIDTGSYIDITGVGLNDKTPPDTYNEYIKEKKKNGESVELYMDRRRHWLTFEKINPLRYSMLGGVPVLVPNDIMSMLNNEYLKGVTNYYYQGYYYVPAVRLWIEESHILPLFGPERYESPSEEQRRKNIIELIKSMDINDKVRLLEANKQILTEYYITQRATGFHEIEKKLMIDGKTGKLILELEDNNVYNSLTAKIELTTPLRKSLFDFEYFGRFQNMPSPKYSQQSKRKRM